MGKIIINGQPTAYTNENSRFMTDVNNPVHPIYLGSVTPEPIYDDENGKILLLEKVMDRKNGNRCFWFMWYDNGSPMINVSGVIDEADITKVIRNISGIKF